MHCLQTLPAVTILTNLNIIEGYFHRHSHNPNIDDIAIRRIHAPGAVIIVGVLPGPSRAKYAVLGVHAKLFKVDNGVAQTFSCSERNIRKRLFFSCFFASFVMFTF